LSRSVSETLNKVRCNRCGELVKLLNAHTIQISIGTRHLCEPCFRDWDKYFGQNVHHKQWLELWKGFIEEKVKVKIIYT